MDHSLVQQIQYIKAYIGNLEVKVKSLSHVRLSATPWTVAYQAPQCMEFSRKEYWSRLPFPSPGDLPSPGIETRSPALQADALPSEPPGKPGDLAKGLRTPKEFDLGGQWDLIAELAWDWGKSVLEAQTKSCAHQEPGERRTDPQETEPYGLLWGCGHRIQQCWHKPF